MKNIFRKNRPKIRLTSYFSSISINIIQSIFLIEHLSGLDGDRDEPAMVEGKFTTGPETERCGGCYSLLVADS